LQVFSPSRSDCDLADLSSIENFLSLFPGKKIDILVNNAGINFPLKIDELGIENWSASLQVNLTAPLLLSQHFAKEMRASGWGRIVNISSVFSLLTKEGRAAYSATKSALNALTRTCAIEWGKDGVLVNSILPGYIDTDLTRQNNKPEQLTRIREQIPLGRFADPSEIARVVVFLCSEQNTYLTGQNVVVDGGFTIQ